MKNTKKIVIRYFWKVLSDDGLFKEPSPIGPYYDEDTLNPYGGFETEDEAVKTYLEMKETHKWGVPYELTLVKIYRAEDVEDF